MIFKNPLFLWLLLCIPPIIYFYFKRAPKVRSSVKFSSLAVLKKLPITPFVHLRHIVFAFRVLTLISLIVALARPQSGKKDSLIQSEGIDIMLCLDTSSSMRGEDIPPLHRLSAAKKVMNDFVQKRMNDRLGLVVYGAYAFLQCPLTLDHGVVSEFLNKVTFIPELENQTAIGMAVSTAVAHLNKSKAKSKVIVLLTDGDNNAGEIDPETAAKLANTFGIKVYTVGMGKPGHSKIKITVNDPFRGKLTQMVPNYMNEGLLMSISEISGGKYFNAINEKELVRVYNAIDQLEKTKISSIQYYEYDERFPFFLSLALLFLLLELGLKSTRLRQLP